MDKEKIIQVLHVDDDESTLDISKNFLTKLSKNKLNIELKTDPFLVRELIQNDKLDFYDVIISDYEMPELNGLDLLREIREKNSLIPVIIFTGRGREEIAIQALNLGANYYINKGLDVESQYRELIHALELVVNQKKTEMALKNSEMTNTAILNAIPDMMFQQDKDGTFLSYKGENEKLYLPPEHFIGKNISELLPKDVAKRSKEMILKTLRTKQLQIFEYNLLMNQGETHEYEARMVPFDENKVLTIVRDITIDKQNQRLTKQSEDFYKNYFDNSPIAQTDRDYSEVKLYLQRLQEKGITDVKEYLNSNPEETISIAKLIKTTLFNKEALKLFSIESKSMYLARTINVMEKHPRAIQMFINRICKFTNGFSNVEEIIKFRKETGLFNVKVIHIIPEEHKKTLNKVWSFYIPTTEKVDEL